MLRRFFIPAALLLSGIVSVSCSKVKEDEVTAIYFTNIGNGVVYLDEGDDSFRLKYVVEPASMQDKAEITWTSSDKDVVSVRKGRLSAESEGKAVITASCGTVSTSVKVEVAPVQVVSFSLPSTVSAYLNQPARVPVEEIVPQNGSLSTIRWSISDETVARWHIEGNALYITGLSQGSTYLSGEASGKTRSSRIEIKEFIPVSSVTLTASETTVEQDKSVTITADITPSTASLQDLRWSLSNESLAEYSVLDSKRISVKTLAPGNLTVTATTGDGKQGTVQIEITPLPLNFELAGVDVQEGNSYNFITPDNSLNGYPSELNFAIVNCSDPSVDLKSAEWTSSKPEVATVEDGKVKAVGHGWTDISATLEGVSKTVRVRSYSSAARMVISKYYGDRTQLNSIVTSKNEMSLKAYDPAFVDDSYALSFGLDYSVSVTHNATGLSFSADTGPDGFIYFMASQPVNTTLRVTSNLGTSASLPIEIDVKSLTFRGPDGDEYGTVSSASSAVTITRTIKSNGSIETIKVYCNPGNSYVHGSSEENDYAWSCETLSGTTFSGNPFEYGTLKTTAVSGTYKVTMQEFKPTFSFNLTVNWVHE